MTKKEIEEEIKRVEAEMKKVEAECINYIRNNAENIADEFLHPPDNGYDDAYFGTENYTEEMFYLKEELRELEKRLEDEEDEEEEEEEEEEE